MIEAGSPAPFPIPDRTSGVTTLIDEAEDVVVERTGIGQMEAFVHLRRAAERTSRTVHEVAAEVVRTRRLPR